MDRARAGRKIVWENFKWIGVFIKNDKRPKRLKVPVHSGKTERRCKLQEGGLKCAGAAELVELPGHKPHFSPLLCRRWAKHRHFWDSALWFVSLPSRLPPREEDISVGDGLFPQVSSTNTTAAVLPWEPQPFRFPWLFGAPPGDGRSGCVVVLYPHFFLRPQILPKRTLETQGSTPAERAAQSQ